MENHSEGMTTEGCIAALADYMSAKDIDINGIIENYYSSSKLELWDRLEVMVMFSILRALGLEEYTPDEPGMFTRTDVVMQLANLMAETGLDLDGIKERAQHPLDISGEFLTDGRAAVLYDCANAIGLYDLT